MKRLIIAGAILSAVSMSAFAGDGQGGNCTGNCNGDGGYRGAPGPVVGAGLPALAFGTQRVNISSPSLIGRRIAQQLIRKPLLYPRSLAAYGSLARIFNSANARPASLPSLVAGEVSSSA